MPAHTTGESGAWDGCFTKIQASGLLWVPTFTLLGSASMHAQRECRTSAPLTTSRSDEELTVHRVTHLLVLSILLSWTLPGRSASAAASAQEAPATCVDFSGTYSFDLEKSCRRITKFGFTGLPIPSGGGHAYAKGPTLSIRQDQCIHLEFEGTFWFYRDTWQERQVQTGLRDQPYIESVTWGEDQLALEYTIESVGAKFPGSERSTAKVEMRRLEDGGILYRFERTDRGRAFFVRPFKEVRAMECTLSPLSGG